MREEGIFVGLTRKQVLTLFGAAAGAPLVTSATAHASDQLTGDEVLTRDVVVIGGGSAGVYAATRLRDLGASVAIVERQNRLGGHCETYVDPRTGVPTNLGVLLFEDNPLVHRHFGRFNIPLVPFPLTGLPPSAYLDLRTGAAVPGYVPPVPTALGEYYRIISQWGPLDTFMVLPDPVPADLLAPFGDFVTKYGLQSIVPTVFQYGQGAGHLLSRPTLFVANLVGPGVIGGILTGSFVTSARGDNAELYRAARAWFGGDAVLGARTLQVDRNFAGGVRVLVENAAGRREIRARKLLFTAPPFPASFEGFTLDQREQATFSQLRTNYYFTAMVRLEGLPPGLQIANTGADTPYHLPPLPAVYTITPTNSPGLWNVQYGSATPMSVAEVTTNIAASIRRINAAGTYPVVLKEQPVIANHTPYAIHVPARAVAAGFYRELYALQGHNHTYYTSAAFHSNNSTRIWAAIESILPSLAS